MTDSENLSRFQQRLAERRAAENKAAPVAPSPRAAPTGFEHLAPEDDRSEEDQALDRVIKSVNIIDAYRRWCGKMNPENRSGQTEGIKISCPVTGHADKVPSAWINTDKQTWYCGGCQLGGDALDIAAYHFGYPVPGYKEGARFHELRRDMAKSMGWTFIKPPGAKSPIAVAPEEVTPPPPVNQSEPEVDRASPEPDPIDPEEKAEDTDSNVVSLFEEDPEIVFPTLEWEELVTADTFLDLYMGACQEDDTPDEYHFWNGLVALGLAVGRDVKLHDFVPVMPNLFICLLGNTGDGKSRSFSHLKQLLIKALPEKWDDPSSKGVVPVKAVASAEALIHAFSKPVADPVNPKLVAYYAPVRGLIEFDELSALTGRANRTGNILKPTLMEFYDCGEEISTSSMTHGKKKASEPFGSAVTTTQPGALRDLITSGDTQSGFLNRWVFVSGKQKKRYAIGGFHVDVTPAIAPLLEIHGWAGHGKMLQWDEDAAVRFTEIFDTVLFPAKQKDQTSLLTRIDLLMKKLILLLCINEKLDTVPLRIVETVYKMYPYIVTSYGIPASSIGNTVQYEVMEDILRHVKNLTEKNSQGASMRELNQRLGKKKYPIRVIKEVLDYMVNVSQVISLEVTKGKRGPATMRYRYVS